MGTQGDHTVKFSVDSHPVLASHPMIRGVTGLVLTPDLAALYWSPLTSHHMFAIQTGWMRQTPPLSDTQLANHTYYLGTRPSVSAGMIGDCAGVAYMGYLQSGSIHSAFDGEFTNEFESASDNVWPN